LNTLETQFRIADSLIRRFTGIMQRWKKLTKILIFLRIVLTDYFNFCYARFLKNVLAVILGSVCVFCCRNENQDLIYGEELTALEPQGIITAFSKSAIHPFK
jgi:hypothetical protein